MRSWTIRFLSLAIALVIATIAGADDAKPGYTVTKTFTIGGDGDWDALVVDPATHQLYITRQSHTQVIDTATGKLIADIPKCGAHGIALVPNLNKGFASGGTSNTVAAFDLKTNAVLYTLPAGTDPNCMVYDPANQKVFSFGNQSHDATVIKPDAAAGVAVLGHIPLDGKPGCAVSDGGGHVYVNIEDQNEIQEIDTKSLIVSNTWKITGQRPDALAIDTDAHHLFACCTNQMVVVDCTTGKTIATTPIGNDAGACVFDPETNEAFVSCGDGTLAIVRETSPGKFETVQTVTTKRGSRTMALDPASHILYLAAAEFLPAAPGKKPTTVKPDTFGVLVVTRS